MMKLQRYCLFSFLCAMTANMSMASAPPFEIKLDSNEPQDYGEFGRSVKPKRRVAKHVPTEADIMYRELIEDVQLMEFSSMSMSMAMSLDDTETTTVETKEPSPAPKPPTGTPTSPQTSAPTEATAIVASCSGQPQVLINIALEVDTVDSSTDIENLIAEALMETLADEYNFCGDRRRLEDAMVKDFLLGAIIVTKDADQICSTPTDPTTTCHVANAAIVVSGETDGAASQLRNSLGFIFENDAKFVAELPNSGVIDVRLKEVSEESEVNSVPRDFGNSAQPTRSAVVAILSTAGISLVAAMILRSRRKGHRAADKFSESDSEGDTIPINNVSGSP